MDFLEGWMSFSNKLGDWLVRRHDVIVVLELAAHGQHSGHRSVDTCPVLDGTVEVVLTYDAVARVMHDSLEVDQGHSHKQLAVFRLAMNLFVERAAP